ncbi:hypothetical protein [Faucicola atlantae]|nr:hypothetical protein [Moraxella atlantae]
MAKISLNDQTHQPVVKAAHSLPQNPVLANCYLARALFVFGI